MPRSARKKSATDIYHVMLRGINRQDIFQDEEDYRRFLRTLSECKALSGFELLCYCLMPNHVHLLIRVKNEPLDKIFRRIGSRYVYWYNAKYERVGHLFQDRYKSEPVEDDAYFLTVFRYILQNPMKAGLETAPGSYPWTSFAAYRTGDNILTDTAYASGYFQSRDDLLAFLRQHNEERAIDISPAKARISDARASAIASEVTGCHSPAVFRQLDKNLQRDYVIRLRKSSLSIAQIVRLTGMPAATVCRITKME